MGIFIAWEPVWKALGFQLHKHGGSGRVAVQCVEAAHRGDFAVAEKAGTGLFPDGLGKHAGVLVFFSEKLRAASQAGEQKGGECRFGKLPRGFKGAPEVVDRRSPIPDLVLKRLPDAGNPSDNNRAGIRIRTEDVFDEKIAGGKILKIFVAGQSRKEVAPRIRFFLVRKSLKGRLQHLVGRFTAERVNNVVVGAGHSERLADWAASLAHHGNEPVAADKWNHRGIDNPVVDEDHRVLLHPPAGQSADRGNAGKHPVPCLQPVLDGKDKRVRQRDPAIGGFRIAGKVSTRLQGDRFTEIPLQRE